MTDRPYILKRLVLPLSLSALAAFAASYFLKGLGHDLFVNLTATFVGSILTVAYIDKVLQRRKELRWAGLRIRAPKRLFTFANSCITTVRTALKVNARAIDDYEEPSQDLRIMRARMIRASQEVLPLEISQIRNMTPAEWARFHTGIQTSYDIGDRLLILFGKDFAPRIAELILDIQSVSQSLMYHYAVWPDLMGVSADKLPRRRDGSSTLPLQQASYKLAERDTLKLLHLCGELLGELDELPSDPD